MYDSVPQGSILGTLLFLVRVNYVTASVDDDCRLILYADDCAMFYVHRDADNIAQKLGSVLEKCSLWLVNNRLSLNLGKAEYILFGPPLKLKMLQILKCLCDVNDIKGSGSVKY